MTRIIVVLALIALLAAPAVSEAMPIDGEVRVGEQVVLRIRASAGGMTPAERAKVVSQRLNNFLGSTIFNSTSVRVQVVRGDYSVVIGNTHIVTVDEATAAANGCTREQLANIWASNIRTAIPAAKAVAS